MSRWYKRSGADFIHGTMMLTLGEKGAYSLCLDLIYDRGGPIPDDARWLSGVCGVSLRKWNAIRERLISLGKIYSDGEHLSNSRADLELVSAELQRRNQAEAGAKGGRKRAENAATSKENSNLAQATLKPIEEIREDKKEVETIVSTAHRPSANPFPRPEWADKQHWADFKLNRKRKRLTDSATAYSAFLAAIEKHRSDEWPPPRLLEYAAGRGWGSINEPEEDGISGKANMGHNGRMGGPRTDPTLALVRAAAEAEREDRWDHGEARIALPSRQQH